MHTCMLCDVSCLRFCYVCAADAAVLLAKVHSILIFVRKQDGSKPTGSSPEKQSTMTTRRDDTE